MILEILILLLLIYNLLIYNPIKNLITFIIVIILLSIKLFIEEYNFISWIFIIIYGSALLILFTYALMIKYKCLNYNRINNLKEYKNTPYIFLLFIIILVKWPLYNIFIYNSIDYKSFFIMKYLLYIQPFFIILLFIELLIAFFILIK